MAKKNNVIASNNRHSTLADMNERKWLSTSPEKGRIFNIRRGYHKSVIWAQNHCGRILSKDERKRVYESVKRENGRSVNFIVKK
ncbi:MAG: hypothetical protein NC037_00305 [Bacteroides sp.]|nr:hypothetical protein [Bacillota bacterium]MCM1393740.1 hypothetical protein [[Eubacterium] siraeum]MCM1454959.1 hypothetical protein [Bacteroides sp.]